MSNPQATVSRILPFSCVDGPGNRLVIFLQGCNFRCLNCHNPHTIDLCDHCGECVASCPSNALVMQNKQVYWDKNLCSQCDKCLEVCPKQASPKTEIFSVEQMLMLIRQHSPFLSGITVTGGEATLHAKFILTLFEAIKTDASLNHLDCMIDSNGSLNLTGWEKLMPVLDGAMIDLKAWQEETHLWLTGRENHKVFKSIQYLANQNRLYEIRLLLIPDKTDLSCEFDALCAYLKQLPENVRIKLNPFQHHGVTGEALGWQKCTQDYVEQFAQKLRVNGITNLIVPSVYSNDLKMQDSELHQRVQFKKDN